MLRNPVSLGAAIVLALGLVLGGSTVLAAPSYGPLTYDFDDLDSQGGPYTFNVNARGISFDDDNLRISENTRGHGLIYDTGFSTNLSSYAVTTTHVASDGERHALYGYAIDGVGAIGVYLMGGSTAVKYGTISHNGDEKRIYVTDVFTAASQVSGDGITDLDTYGTFTNTMAITDTGNNATSTFAHTVTQDGNVWQYGVTFDDLITADAGFGAAPALIAAARDSGQGVGYAFYTFLNGSSEIRRFDNTSVIPEPSSFVLAGFGLLSLALWGWRRRR